MSKSEPTGSSDSEYTQARSRERKFQVIAVLLAISGGLLLPIFPPAIALAALGFFIFWNSWWRTVKLPCPRCGKQFGLGGESIIGNGRTSCYHCGWHGALHALEILTHFLETRP